MLNKLRFFKEATLCLDDSFAHSWHSLNQLHEEVTWNAFELTGVPWVNVWNGGGGEMVWWCFAGDTVCDLF